MKQHNNRRELKKWQDNKEKRKQIKSEDGKKILDKLRSALQNISTWCRTNRNAMYMGFMFVALICIIVVVKNMSNHMEAKETMVQKPVASASPVPTAVPTAIPEPTPNPEEAIYSYLQGPKSWGNRLAWSGYWGTTFMDGGSFGGFGCGLCCIANVYSSVTPYKCTPVQAYHYTKKHTGYTGGGALEWGYMRRTLTSLGFDCGVKKKPSDYKTFQTDIAGSMASVVLISSSNSTCYWKDTPGHYVTIFLYNPQTDKVFLADSGDPKHNRHWVSLKKIYKSLKTSSSWQYLPVVSYNENEDGWKHKSVRGNWVKEASK